MLAFLRVLWYNDSMKNDDYAVKNTTPEGAVLVREIDELKRENEELRRQNEWLLAQLKLSKKRQFGASSEKSEYDFAQLNLFNEAEACSDESVQEQELTEVKKHYRKRTRLTTDKLPEDLPVEVVEHKLPESEQVCPDCGNHLRVMGHESREELVLIPASAKIRRHISATYACRHCETHSDRVPIVKSKFPEPVIKGSFASPEAIAHIAAQKFVMGTPLYRQEQEWNRNGIPLSRQTMSNWLIRATEARLEPIYDELKRRLLRHEVLHADETTLQVLNEPGKTAQSKSYMWLYRTSGDAKHQIVLYEYQPSRKYEHPKAFLKGFTGYLHADGYDGYHDLPENITVVGCWAHLRRKFDEALKIIEPKAREGTESHRGKQYCDRLFELERQFKDLSSDERHRKRQELSRPVIEEFFAWITALRTVPKTPIGVAKTYALSQQKYLERYLLDGRLEISNNRAERSIKPFVIGRKNWLFANTVRGAKASAILYSLIETAKENGLVPFEYLTRVFRDAPNGAVIEDLLPWGLDTCN